MCEGWPTVGMGGKPLDGALNLAMVGGKRYGCVWSKVLGTLAHLWRKPNIFKRKSNIYLPIHPPRRMFGFRADYCYIYDVSKLRNI